MALTPPVPLIPQGPLHTWYLQGSFHNRCLAHLRSDDMVQCSGCNLDSFRTSLSQEGLNSLAQCICWFTFMANCFLYELSVRIVPSCSTNKACFFLASESFIDFWRCSIPPMKCFLPYFIQCLGYFETGGILVILLNTITRNVVSPTKNVNMLLCYWKWGQAIGHLKANKEARLVGKENFFYCGGWQPGAGYSPYR